MTLPIPSYLIQKLKEVHNRPIPSWPHWINTLDVEVWKINFTHTIDPCDSILRYQKRKADLLGIAMVWEGGEMALISREGFLEFCPFKCWFSFHYLFFMWAYFGGHEEHLPLVSRSLTLHFSWWDDPSLCFYLHLSIYKIYFWKDIWYHCSKRLWEVIYDFKIFSSILLFPMLLLYNVSFAPQCMNTCQMELVWSIAIMI